VPGYHDHVHGILPHHKHSCSAVHQLPQAVKESHSSCGAAVDRAQRYCEDASPSPL
jgi:hypothetical protein